MAGSLNNTALAHCVLDSGSDAVDEMISSDLMHQMEKMVEVMGDIRDEIMASYENDRIEAKRLMQKVNNMRVLQQDADNPARLSGILENIEYLVNKIMPNHNSKDVVV